LKGEKRAKDAKGQRAKVENAKRQKKTPELID